MNSKNIILILLLCTLFTNCLQTDFDHQIPPDEIIKESADLDLVLTHVQRKFVKDIYSGYYIPLGKTNRYLSLDDSYNDLFYNDLGDDKGFLGVWKDSYEVGKNIKLIEDFSEGNDAFSFHRGMSRVIWAYTFANLVDVYGRIPYFEALDPIGFPHPKFDNGEDVYADLYRVLDLAQEDFELATQLDENQDLDAIPEEQEIIYGGNIESWIRLANSLKLRLLVQSRLSNPEFSKVEINKLLEKDLFIRPEDDFEYRFGTHSGTSENSHEEFDHNYDRAPSDYISNHFIYTIKDSKLTHEEEEDDDDDVDDESQEFVDPRIRFLLYRQLTHESIGFDIVNACWEGDAIIEGFNYCYSGDNYLGRDHGFFAEDGDDRFIRTLPGVYPIGGAFDEDDGIKSIDAETLDGKGINPVLQTSYMCLLKAEAALMLGTEGDPREYLKQGIQNSINKIINFTSAPDEYNPDEEAIQNYLDLVLAAFDAAESDQEKLRVIIDELYIAAWGNPIEVYNAYRRTGYPAFPPPVDESVSEGNVGVFPRSLVWPPKVVEDNQNLNFTNKSYKEQVFWDTNPEDFIH